METITLHKKQQEAVRFFQQQRYLDLEAPRRSGKTTLLRAIVAMYPEKKIGVYCLGYNFFLEHYKEFTHCTYLDKNTDARPYDLLIGDEIYLEPREDKMTACARSRRHITLRWALSDNPFVMQEHLEELKKVLSPTAYEIEFGQYENKERSSES